MSLCFSSCSLLQRKDSTLHTLTIHRASVSFSSKGILKENISQHHTVIFVMIPRYVIEAMMCKFQICGERGNKVNLGLTSLLGIDTSFVPALTSSLGLEVRTMPIQIWRYFYSELEAHNPRPQCA